VRVLIYTDQDDKIIKEWADKASAYQWLHLFSHESYVVLYRWFMIPVIIISAVAGTLNFAQASLFGDSPYGAVVVGTIVLISSLMISLTQFLKLAENMEGCVAST
jgi:hypothetical protein